MAYVFKYRLNSAPQARNDGSGMVDHDIDAIVSIDGGDFATVPGRHKTISVPADELEDALGQATTPNKVTAYKAALADNLNTQPEPVLGWDIASMTAVMNANIAASTQATAANTFILSVSSYPVEFAY